MKLSELRERVQYAAGPDRELDLELARCLVPDVVCSRFNQETRDNEPFVHWRYTGSIDAAFALINRVLPDFWITCGLCNLTGHASIGPDYNGPNGDRLRKEWPEDVYHAGFDSDLAPGDGIHRTCLALIDCALSALIAKEEAGRAALQEQEG